MHIILVEKKQSVKQRNRPISGPILSDPVIRPDPMSTRIPVLNLMKVFTLCQALIHFPYLANKAIIVLVTLN